MDALTKRYVNPLKFIMDPHIFRIEAEEKNRDKGTSKIIKLARIPTFTKMSLVSLKITF